MQAIVTQLEDDIAHGKVPIDRETPRGGERAKGSQSGEGMRGGRTQEHEVIQINRDTARVIIGKKGVRIRKIQDDSGARVSVDSRMDGDEESVIDRNITIQGDARQVASARTMVEDIIKELEESKHRNTQSRTEHQ